MNVSVRSPGTFFWTQGGFTISDWHFVSEAPATCTQQEVLAAVLIHIAQCNGLDLVARQAMPAAPAPEPEPIPLPEHFDAQRAALDAIAVARWRDDL